VQLECCSETHSYVSILKSCKCFNISCPLLLSLFHFVFIFVPGDRFESIYCLLHIHFPQHCLVKSFFFENVLPFFKKQVEVAVWVCFLVFSSIATCICFTASDMLFCYCCSVVYFVGIVIYLTFIFYFSIYLSTPGLLFFHRKFSIFSFL
jgi:hypothetical protein